jgi:uncharacterized protein YdhG (YjbR/CyaY superfamily)
MPTVIDEYLAPLPKQQRVALSRLRALICSAVPDAEEAIKTRVPVIRYRGKTVVGFGATNGHLALYVMFGNALKLLRDDLAPFDTSNKVVRFSPADPLPAAVVRKVVAVRLAEIERQSVASTAPSRTVVR